MKTRKAKEQRAKRSVAGATAKRRERAERGFTEMFNLPKGTEMFTVDSAGTKKIDIIPYVVGKGNPNADEGDYYWERTFFAHRSIGINEEWFICPSRTMKKKCPICEYAAKLQNDSEVDDDTVKALLPSRRMLINVRDLKKDPDTVKVWHVSHAYFGRAIDQALAAAYEDENENMDSFCDPEDGYFVKALAETGWEGRGFSVERVDFISRKQDLDDEILEQAVCLDDVLVIKSYEELKEALFAGERDEDEEEEEDEEEGDKEDTGKSHKHRRKRRDEMSEEEEWDEEDEEEEEEEEVKHKKKGKEHKRSRKEESDEEDEEKPEEDDEEEPGEEDDDWPDEDEDEDEDKSARRKKSKKR